MYTLFYHAASRGDTVLRALSWEFPNDPSVGAVDTQFMLGPAIMVLPVLTKGASTVSGVFPGPSPWYDWYNQTAVPADWQKGTATVPAPQGHIPIYVRGGSVLPLQQPANTTAESRQKPWDILIALNEQGQASGDLYLDDGESQVVQDTKLATLDVAHATLTVKVEGQYELDGAATYFVKRDGHGGAVFQRQSELQ